jgi:hypothetical protein
MVQADWTPILRAINETNDQLFEINQATDAAQASLMQSIEGLFDELAPGLLDALIGAVSVGADLAAGLLESLTTVDDIFVTLTNWIREHWMGSLAHVIDGIMGTIVQAFNVIGDYAANFIPAIIDAVNKSLDATVDRSRGPDDLFREFGSFPGVLRLVIGVLSLAGSVFSYANAAQAGGISSWEQLSLRTTKPTPLSLAQLTELVKREEVGRDWAQDHAERTGYSGELFDLATKLEQVRLSPHEYITQWLRTDSDSPIDEIRKLGVSDDDIARLKFLAFVEPTPSDIVRFLVRDAYDEGAVQRNLYDEDFDAKYRAEAFNKVGVSRDLARLYWRAHWQLPSPTQGYEMLHREQIDMAQLRELLKLADYAPGYVDHLINIAYNVPGRIDLRRMWEIGSITDRGELVRRYGHLGYNPQDAELLADFSIRLSERAAANEAARKRAPIVAQVIRSYLLATITRDETLGALQSLGLTPDEAEFRVREGDYGRERDRADRIRDSIGRLYTRGQTDEQTARERLSGYGFQETEIATLFDSWNLDRELRDLTEAEQHEKDLSKSEIIASFENALLDYGSAHNALFALGYDEAESHTLLQLSQAKQARASAKLEQDSIRTSFINRRISREEASSRLDSINTVAERRDSLLDRWTVEREEKAPDLPIAWLERLIFHAEISEDDARTELQRRGFTEQEVAWALQLWGTEVSVARERLVQTRELAEQRAQQQAEQFARRISVQERALELRERTATTAQVLQQERFTQSLEQRERLAQQRVDAAAAGRVQAASLQAERDARRFAQTRELQANQVAAAADRLTRQIEAAASRQEDAQAQQRELQARREEVEARRQQAQDARQERSIAATMARLERQIAAAEARAAAAASLRLELQGRDQEFRRQEREAREAAEAARRVEQEAARIRQESRQEVATIRREERGAARRTIERAEAAAEQEELRSLQLRRDQMIAELNAQLAALEATAAEERIARAEAQQREAADRLASLVNPALQFEPVG